MRRRTLARRASIKPVAVDAFCQDLGRSLDVFGRSTRAGRKE